MEQRTTVPELLRFLVLPWSRVAARDELTVGVLRRLAVLERRLTTLETLMAQTAEAIAQLNAETNDLSARVDRLLAHAVADFDAATAAELRAISSRLKGLAADPGNPVPPVEPTE